MPTGSAGKKNMKYSCHFTSSLVKNGSKTIKGGTWLYNTALNIFTTCGKSFMHRLPCRFEESCPQSRQCSIKGKKGRYSPACSADSTGDTTPSTQPQPAAGMLPAEPGRGKKNAFNEETLVPINTASHIPSLCMLNKSGKTLPRQSLHSLLWFSGCCSPHLCSHSGFLCSHRFFCHVLRLGWINLHFLHLFTSVDWKGL